jgi:hypothetical protein
MAEDLIELGIDKLINWWISISTSCRTSILIRTPIILADGIDMWMARRAMKVRISRELIMRFDEED